MDERVEAVNEHPRATLAPHECNGWCRPPVHFTIIYTDTEDPAVVQATVSNDFQTLGVPLVLVSVERAWDAPPKSFYGDRMTDPFGSSRRLDDSALAYRIGYTVRARR